MNSVAMPSQQENAAAIHDPSTLIQAAGRKPLAGFSQKLGSLGIEKRNRSIFSKHPFHLFANASVNGAAWPVK